LVFLFVAIAWNTSRCAEEADDSVQPEAVGRATVESSLPSPLCLTDAKAFSVRNHPSIRAAAQSVRAAAAIARQARSAYWPTLSLATSAEHTHEVPVGDGGMGVDPFNTYTIGATINWLVFDGYARRFSVAAAKYNEAGETAALAEVQRLLMQAVSRAYFNALLAQEQMIIAKRDAEFNGELTTETEKRYNAGVAAKSDVLNFQIRLAEAESKVITAQFDFRIAAIVLARLLGLRTAQLPRDFALEPIAEIPQSFTSPEAESEIDYALRGRPDLIRFRLAVKAAEATVRATESEYWPSVTVQAGYGETRKKNPRWNNSSDASSYIGLTVSWDVFTGGSTGHAVAAAEAAAGEAREEIAERYLAIAAEVRQQVATVKMAREQAQLRRRIFDMTAETRDLVRRQYDAGTTSLTRLNEAQTDLVRAEGLHALARIRLWLALDDLDAVVGRSVENTDEIGAQ